jgi:site-specific DNA-methyltransferase (adenine-specific)
MQGEKAEMVWTDPPYGVSVGDKNKYLNSIARSNRVEENLENDTIDEAGITALLVAAFDNATSHCTAGAAWYVAAPPGPLHLLFGAVLKDRGIWRQTIQWVKNNATFSPMGVCYHWQAEPIFFGWLPNAGHRWYGGRKQTTVWNIDRPTKSPEHPTMKPVELVDRAVSNSSQPGEIVFDPFLGSGTTMVAAHRLGRRCFGCEIDPGYAAVCLQRMSDMGLTPVLTGDNSHA